MMTKLKAIYARLTHRHHWESAIRDGDLIRTCSITGEMEYRDVKQQKWIPIESVEELDSLRERRGAF